MNTSNPNSNHNSNHNYVPNSQYSIIANVYAQIFPPQQAFIRFIQQLWGQNHFKQIVDLGCGPGLYLQEWVGMGIPCLGLELSPQLRDQSAHNEPKVTNLIHLGDLTTPPIWLPIIPKQPTIAYCIGNTFSYLNIPQQQALIQQLAEHLPSGSLLILQTVNWDAIVTTSMGQKSFPNIVIEQSTFTRRYKWWHLDAVSFELRLHTPEGVHTEEHTLYTAFSKHYATHCQAPSIGGYQLWGAWPNASSNPPYKEDSSNCIAVIQIA